MTLSTQPYALVVDDDALIRMDAAAILQDAGYRTFEAEDADAAIKILKERADDIVLLFTDVEMPGERNGFDLARFAEECSPHIEIVVASGNVKPQPGDMPPKATFIEKPFDEKIVHEHLRTHLPDGKKPEPLKTAVG